MTGSIPKNPPEITNDVDNWWNQQDFLDDIIFRYTSDQVAKIPYSAFHRNYALRMVLARTDEEMTDALTQWEFEVAKSRRLQVQVYDDVLYKETKEYKLIYVVPPIFCSIQPKSSGYSYDSDGFERESFYISLKRIQSQPIRTRLQDMIDARFTEESVEEDYLTKVWKELWLEILFFEEQKFIQEGTIKAEDSIFFSEDPESNEPAPTVIVTQVEEDTEWIEDDD